MTTALYDPTTALRSFYQNRSTTRDARVWANEALLADLTSLGVSYFSGNGSDPTAIAGYAIDKLWLKTDAGVTTARGEIRGYAGSGSASSLTNWPVLDKAGLLRYLSLYSKTDIDTIISSLTVGSVGVATRTALKAVSTSWPFAMLTEAGRQGAFVWDSTVLVATHQADTQEGVYVAPNPVANGAWVRVYDGPVRARWFGAKGDGSTDDTTKLAAFAAFLGTTRSGTLDEGKTYLISDTITFGPGSSLDFGGAEITYNGARTKPAIVHGTNGIQNENFRISRVRITALTVDWADRNFVGLKVINGYHGWVETDIIRGFTTAYEAYSCGKGYTLMHHRFGGLKDAKYGCVLTTDGSLTGGGGIDYVTENNWLGGDCTNDSTTSGLGSCYGVVFRRVNGGANAHDDNRFHDWCFQPGDGNPGDERIPVLLDNCGTNNIWTEARHESGRGPFAKVDGTTEDYVLRNQFDVLLAAGSSITYGVNQLGTARFNTIKYTQRPDYIDTDTIYADIFNNVVADSTTGFSVSGGLHITNSSGDLSDFLGATSIRQRRTSIGMAAGSSTTIGFFVEVDAGDSFCLTVDSEAGYPGRPYVSVYDGNFVRRTTGTDIVAGTSGSPTTYTSSYGGAYNAGADGASYFFEVRASGYIRCFSTGGSAEARIKGMRLSRLSRSNRPLHIVSGSNLFSAANRYSEADPSGGVIGRYARGDLILSSVAGTTGTRYWQCTTAGWLAKARQNSTAYAVDDTILADTNKIYYCAVAGTTAGSGGPTGTSNGQTDGTVTWNYLSPQAAFTAK